MTEQPHFNGSDYDHDRDAPRLSVQMDRVMDCIKDGQPRTLRQIALATGDPEASVSAQLRHMRKPRFGGHVIARQHLGGGLYTYRLVKGGES
jgi:hypothetical protein